MNKKALSILLAGATAASVVVASAASASAVYEDFQLEGATYGVIGDFNSWGGDVALTDEDGDGLYTATVSVPAEGSSYKVRANGGWDYSWGATNADGVTANSQDNCKFDESVYGKDVTVYFDTRTGKSGVDTWYVGTEEPAAPTPSESSQESSQESSEESSTPEVPAGKYAEAYKKASEQLGEENLSKYYFFDNSESKWAKVGAYWWTPAENATWPGQEAIQIEGTDVWAIEYNAETTKIIFNNLVSDDEYTVDNPKIQTSDVKVDATANAGNIYIPDVSSADAKENGAAVTYKEGNWVVFDASGEPSVVPEPSEEESSNSAPADDSKTPSTPSNDGKDGKKGVETGDSATPIALAAVFAAAALTAVVLTKKKVSSK
ncbi:MAG: hypothetical protein SOT80_10280 [Candidatus Pseudoruminococcus sp.]|nr:hypothetical protein [Ruminococcus sp.]MDY2783764.1 hypothetical protein [Candidatus Pseudoruminococcus sp.]